jgi:hypothetical protein
MFSILLQVDSLANGAKSAGQVESVWSLLGKGGPLMIPLGLLFALAVFFFIERLLAVKKAAKIDENFMRIIRDHIITGNVSAARSLAKNTDNPVARMIDKGIQRIGKADRCDREKAWTMWVSSRCTKWKKTFLYFQSFRVLHHCSDLWVRS